MRDENLSGTAVVIGSDDAASLELTDEFGSALVADVETVAQHHGCDGCAVTQELDGFLIERVAIRQWRRQDSDVFGGNVDSRCRWRGTVKTGSAVGAEVGASARFMPALGTVNGARGLDGGIQFKVLVGDIGIVTHNVQLAQALWADDLIIAVDEHLGTQVHLFATFGTGIVHNRYRVVILLQK